MLLARRLILALALIVTSVSAAHAQINLAWNACITQSSAAENIQYACDGSGTGAPFKLVASFVAPNDLPFLVGTQMYLDVALPTGNDPLPDWWRLGAGECREISLDYPASMNGVGSGSTGACPNPWTGACAGAFRYTSDYQGNPSRAYIQTIFATVDPNYASVMGGRQYVAGVFTLNTVGDTEESGSVCSGCCQPMMITLTKIGLYQRVDSPGGDILQLTTAGDQTSVWWNKDGCQSSGGTVPTRRASWGAVKATYR